MGSHSTASSRRPGLSHPAVESRRSSATSTGRPSIPKSIESSGPTSPVFCDANNPPFTAPACPDLDQPPYAKPLGSVFHGDEWAPFMDRLDDNVIKVVNVCQSIALHLNTSVERLSYSGLHYNILALDELTIAEITRDCWLLIYEIICKGLYEWNDLLRERNILARVKCNL